MGLISGVEANVGVARPAHRVKGTLASTFAAGIDTLQQPSGNWIWAMGARLVSDTCGTLQVESIECSGSSRVAYESWGGEVAFDPIDVWVGRQCGVLSGKSDADLSAAARRRLEEGISYQVALELYRGTVTGNPAITISPTVLTVAGALTVLGAFEALETAIASEIGNLQATIHVTPAMLVAAARESLIELVEGMAYQTPTGHWVVGDAAYTGSAPTGSPLTPAGGAAVIPALGAGEQYLYATGPVAWDYGPEEAFQVEDAGTLSARENRRRAIVQRPAIAVFDPNCLHLAVLGSLTPS